MNSIATAIFLGVSVTDHSCKPNAVATFEGITLHIHAIEEMEYLDWSKVFIFCCMNNHATYRILM